MTGKVLGWIKSCKLHFRAYAHVQKVSNLTNMLEDRTQGAICLGPTGNLQVTYSFFSLRSGKKITRGKFTEVPNPAIIMKQVAAMVNHQITDGLRSP